MAIYIFLWVNIFRRLSVVRRAEMGLPENSTHVQHLRRSCLYSCFFQWGNNIFFDLIYTIINALHLSRIYRFYIKAKRSYGHDTFENIIHKFSTVKLFFSINVMGVHWKSSLSRTLKWSMITENTRSYTFFIFEIDIKWRRLELDSRARIGIKFDRVNEKRKRPGKSSVFKVICVVFQYHIGL